MGYLKEINEYLNGVYYNKNSISDAIPDNMKTNVHSMKQISIPFCVSIDKTHYTKFRINKHISGYILKNAKITSAS